MNNLLKIIFRGENILVRNGGSSRREHQKMLSCRSYCPLTVAPFQVFYMNQTKARQNRNGNCTNPHARLFSKQKRVKIIPKTFDVVNTSNDVDGNMESELSQKAKTNPKVFKVRESWGQVSSLKYTPRRIREKGELIIKDIKETKDKMKGKLEEVIEKENIYTIPNLLCVTRIGLSPLLGYLIVQEKFEYALTFMVVAGISDWVDGWIARNYKSQCSQFGSFLDPMADKVLIGTLFLTLTYIHLIPGTLTALIIGKDVVLIISGFVIRYLSLPPPRTLSRYFDVTYATAQLAPTFISKVNTGIQLALAATTLAAPVFGYVNHPYQHVLWYVTGASTMVAAGSYVFSKETYKFTKKKKGLGKRLPNKLKKFSNKFL